MLGTTENYYPDRDVIVFEPKILNRNHFSLTEIRIAWDEFQNTEKGLHIANLAENYSHKLEVAVMKEVSPTYLAYYYHCRFICRFTDPNDKIQFLLSI